MGSPPPPGGGGACSSPPRMMMVIHPPSTPSPSKRMRSSPESDPTSTSTCFHCKKPGHWVRDCPLKTPPTPPKLNSNRNSNSATISDDLHLPEIECDNGHGPCSAKVSRSRNNPGRIYYACPNPNPNGSKCGFFKWYDQLKMTNDTTTSGAPTARPLTPTPTSLSLSQSEYPMCSCGAGICRLMMETSAPNAGRLYFVCPITKGHGACPFLLWYDGKENTKRTTHVDESRMTFESAAIDNLPPSTFDVLPFGPSDIEVETLIGREEHDNSNMETSTNYSNLQVVLREHLHDAVVQKGALLDPMKEKPPHVSQKTSLQTEIVHQLIEFWRQSFAAGNPLTGDGAEKMFGFLLLGWLGRLAFGPSGCLTVPPSKPPFFGVSPSLPIFIRKEIFESHSEGLIDLPQSPSHSDFHSSPQMPSGDDDQPLSGVLFELSGLKKVLGPSEDGIVTGTIVEALEQAALPIQNLLLTLLESMDPLKPESMEWAADCTFAALDHLSVDYRPFSERVRKFIACASSLAEINRSIHNDLSSQELIKCYHNERDRFDNISRTHDDIVGALTTSDHRLESLCKEASRVKEMLLQIENQVSLCRAEMSMLKTRESEISNDKNDCEKRLQAAAQKAEAAMELCHQREVTRNAAKAAFEEARVKLHSP